MSNSDIVEDTYKGPRHDGEYQRLRVQHELVKANMNGKLVRAPIDFTSSTLKVLDSATADGYWLVDLARSLHPQARLVGTDIAPQYFLMEDKPANVELHLHNIFDAWPKEYVNAFDLVHQRFVLPVCNDAQSLDSIQKLFACVKPGGYIQLHDGDMETIIEGPDRIAMTRFRDMMGMAWGKMGHNLSPGPKLAHWLKEAGGTEIQETLVTNECGPHVADQVQSERAISVLLALLDGASFLLGSKF
jgi:SAM-dependent methyltransferase